MVTIEKCQTLHPPIFTALSGKSVPHILEKIFFSLDYESFMRCLEVSKSWTELLTSESFKRMGKSEFQENIVRELLQATDDGNLKEVRGILSSGMVDVDCIGGPDDQTPLHVASFYGQKDVVQLLLDEGAEIDKADIDGRTPLHLATYDGYKDVIILLLHRGADPKKASKDGESPLHDAASCGHRDVVEVLLDGGDDPNKADMDDWTPLHYASYNGHKDVVKLLLLRGADKNNVTVRGNTALSIAFDNGHTDVVNILQDGGT